MKKMLKIIGIFILCFVVMIVAIFIYVGNQPSAPKNYWAQIQTEGEIESKYNQLGSYTVIKKEYDAPDDETDQTDNHFVVWAPEEIGTYPLLVMINGTGVPCDKYESVFQHFASWGYVVIGNNYATNWNGKHASETLDFALNTEEISAMIDVNKIAIGGHSQGGMATFNAITEYDNGENYKVAFSLSPTNDELAIALQWGFELGTDEQYAFRLDKITIPMFIVAGTGPFDNDTVSPLHKMQEEYDTLTSDKVICRRADEVDHGAILYDCNGYVIAWLDLYLKNTDENEKAFFGSEPEIQKNARYQDFQSNKVN